MMAPIIFFLLLVSSPIRTALGDGEGSWGSSPAGPSESECRPYIEKALQGASHHEPESSNEQPGIDDDGDRGLSNEDQPQSEASESSEILQDTEGGENERPSEDEGQGSGETETAEAESVEEVGGESPANQEDTETEEALSREEDTKSTEQGDAPDNASAEDTAEVENAESTEQDAQSAEPETQSVEDTQEINDEKPEEVSEETLEAVNAESTENTAETASTEDEASTEPGVETTAEDAGSEENAGGEGSPEDAAESGANEETAEETSGESPAEEGSAEAPAEEGSAEAPTEEASAEKSEEQGTTAEEIGESVEETAEQNETSQPHESNEEITQSPSGEATDESVEEPSRVERSVEEEEAKDASGEASVEESTDSPASGQSEEEAKEDVQEPAASAEEGASVEEVASEETNVTESQEGESSAEAPAEGEETSPEEELSVSIEIPEKLRSRDHMVNILRLNEENEDLEKALGKTIESTLKDLKKLYDAAIKPLEILYKYRDLSNRHFGDPEIFSKPLILFMGPWSGGKSTIINYLLENEYKKTALRTGAEPSPAYFNIVMWGEQEEVLDGTQLAADWTFSGLQKFGQGLLDRLRGLRLNHPLLEKVNIVEIPGILEIRKQVERLFPFNDACQWFIDRADIIFLVYDPSKLDVGPETEAILDQLKGREMQTRIVLNKADQVKPEELMRVQGTLIWNISPLMSSTEPPVMYSTSLWSIPYEAGAPARLLYAQELAFLRDLRDAIDKRVENKIASARRFAVRVRNHAKMVDCYLTTYYNHKTFFGNKKKISDDIIEHPQNYHIYEGLSTLTNISRYDLPDPDVYRDFFRLNPVYEFQQLSSTCTYFRGCPINRLDVAIAYDLPELVGRYKKHAEEIISSFKK